MRRRQAFSIIELLVVIAIIALLIAILLPAIARVKVAARSTQCLGTLQSLGHCYSIYENTNGGRKMLDRGDFMWYYIMLPGASGGFGDALLCPEARVPGPDYQAGRPGWTITRGTATEAWITKTRFGTQIGSYGFNYALYQPPGQSFSDYFLTVPAKDTSNIPLFCDCVGPNVFLARTSDSVPADLYDPGKHSDGLAYACIDRHAMAVNVCFLDGHAERVHLPTLWKLKWSQSSTPRDVTVPGKAI